MGLISEFKDFINKGNVIDLAVGVVIAGAFNPIIKSFVSDILMPPIGLLLGGVDFTKKKLVLKEAIMNGAEVATPEVAIGYGNLINNIVVFLITAFAVFMVVKAYNSMQKAEEEAAPAAPPADVVLLEEIRDLLKK